MGEKGKRERGNGDDDRGKGKAEKLVHIVFHFSRNRELGPVFMFFTG
jgi:hypothetical protein